MELFLYSILAVIGICIFLLFTRRRKAVIKLVRFLNNDFLTIEDYKVKNIYGLSEIVKDGRMWKITKDVSFKILKLGNVQYPCLILHDAVNKPLDVDIDEQKLSVEVNPEITSRIAEQKALRELLKPRVEHTPKQVLIYILMGLLSGFGIGALIGGWIR